MARTTSKAKRGKKKPRVGLITVSQLGDFEESLSVVGMTAFEKLSAPFEVRIELKANDPLTFDFDKLTDSLIGSSASISVQPSNNADDAVRHFHGEMSAVHLEDSAEFDSLGNVILELRPGLWRLSRSADTRLFVEMTTRDIVTQLLDAHGLAGQYHWHASPAGTARVHAHRWQLGETDLEFFERLLEEDAYVYWFTFKENGHALHIADAPPGLPELGGEPLRLGVIGPGGDGKGRIGYLRRTVEASAEAYVVRGRSADGQTVLTGLAKEAQHGRSGTFREADGSAEKLTESTDEARRRLASLLAECRRADGSSDVRALSAGTTVAIAGRGQTRAVKYRLTSVQHEATQATASYSNRFLATKSDSPFALPRTHAKPMLTAAFATVVEGPNENGHYRLRFDIDGSQRISSWVPLSRETDVIFLPRAGHRVLVGFAENNPDHPTILHLVDPPGTLPYDPEENPNLGGLFTPKHQLAFNSDPKDMWMKLHSSGDVDDTALGNRNLTTAGDRLEIVQGDADWAVKKNVSWSSLGSYAHRLAESFSVDAKSISLRASERIELICKDSYIVIDSKGVTIKGKPVVHLNPPTGAAPAGPPATKERVEPKAKQPKLKKARK